MAFGQAGMSYTVRYLDFMEAVSHINRGGNVHRHERRHHVFPEIRYRVPARCWLC